MSNSLISNLIKRPGNHQVLVLNCGGLVLKSKWKLSDDVTCPIDPNHFFPVVIDSFQIKIDATSDQTELTRLINERIELKVTEFDKNPKLTSKLLSIQRTYTKDQVHSNYQHFLNLPYYKILLKSNNLAYSVSWSELLFWSIINRQQNLIAKIAQYANLEQPIDSRGMNMSPLHLAVLYGQLEAVETIVKLFPLAKRERMINQLTSDQVSALHYAVRYNYEKIAECLLDAGADVDQRDSFGGKTPLVYAIMNGNLNLMQVLIAHGANVHLTFDVKFDNDIHEYTYKDLVSYMYFRFNTVKENEILEILDFVED